MRRFHNNNARGSIRLLSTNGGPKVRRLLIVVVLIALIMMLTVVPALAGTISGTAQCGGGGYMYTKATTDWWQEHKIGPSSPILFAWDQPPMRRTITVSWGFRSGSISWYVTGPNISGNGWCVT